MQSVGMNKKLRSNVEAHPPQPSNKFALVGQDWHLVAVQQLNIRGQQGS